MDTREMHESGSPWIGLSPRCWSIRPIKHCIKQRQGGAWGDEETTDESNYRSNLVCIRVADFDFQHFGIRKDKPYTFRSYDQQTITKLKLQQGDILVEKSGGGEKTPVGRAVIFDDSLEALYANFLERFRLTKDIDPRYFLYSWNSFYKLGHTRLYIKQTTGIQNLDFAKILANESILVPPLKEQALIVDFLDSKCAEIDALTADIEKQIETLQEYKKSVITEAVTKGLDPNVEMKDSGAWFGVLPNTWQICRLKNYACIKNGKDYKEVFQEDGPIPVYGSGGVFTQSSKPLYTKQSVLLGRKGTINKPLFVDQPFWTVDTMYYTEINPMIHGRYFFYLCTTIPFGFYQYGSAVPSMTQSDLLNVKFPLPPKSEQEKIAEVLDTKCIQIDATIEEKQKQLGTLSQYKQSLIYEYVTGKKTVPNA